jgi:hypothetical protein
VLSTGQKHQWLELTVGPDAALCVNAVAILQDTEDELGQEGSETGHAVKCPFTATGGVGGAMLLGPCGMC